MKIATELGNLTLNQRGKKGYYQLSIHFNENLGRFRQSTKTSQLEIAVEIAKNLTQKEFNRRLMGLGTVKPLPPSRYLLEAHIPQLKNEIGICLDNHTEVIRTQLKTNTDIKILLRWFLPFIANKTWLYLESHKSGTELVSSLRKHKLKEQTIKNYLGTYNRFLRHALYDGHITQLTKYPAISKGKKKRGMYVDGYACSTIQMLEKVENILTTKIDTLTHQSRKRAAILSYAWFLILKDTGIRPYSSVDFLWSDIEIIDRARVCFWRKEKGIEYKAYGTQETIRALNMLKKLYFSEGLNIGNHSKLPVFHKKDSKEQINTITNTLNTVLKQAGWYAKLDDIGRKYRAYSIRKWHINHSIGLDENPFHIAYRVGHSYQTLERYYLSKDIVKKGPKL
tara:strand:- start:262 stop:1446 length:1185 start_codon:yes stop_codon:yes gene_type:complete